MNPRSGRRSIGGWARRGIAVALGTFLLAYLSRRWFSIASQRPTIWLPAGWDLFALLKWGPAIWPGVWLGRLADGFTFQRWIVGAPVARSLFEALILASVSAFQAWAGHGLLRRWGSAETFLDQSRHVFRLTATLALSALVGSTAMTLIPWRLAKGAASSALQAWGTEWMAQLVGMGLATPLATAATRRDSWTSWPHRWPEIVGEFAVLFLITEFVFGPWLPPKVPLAFLLLPVICGMAFRLPPLEILAMLFAMTLEIVRRTGQGHGPFVDPVPAVSSLLVQVFSGTVTVTALAIQAEVRDRRAAHEALRQERDFTAAIQEVIGALVVVLDREGRIVRFNRACEATTGYREEEVRGKPFWDIFLLPEEAPEVKEVFATLRAGHFPLRHENYWVTKDGRRRWIAWSNTCLAAPDGTVQYVIGTGIDLTERREAEEAAQRLTRELEQRVRERTAELEAANRELEAFSFSVSHDLRAPLRAIDGFAQVLTEDYASILDTQGKEYLSRVRAGTQRMGQLIDDLLQLSRAMRAVMHREKVDLACLGRAIVSELRQSEPARNVEVVIQDDLSAWGDPILLEDLVRNLLHNAWKFTSRCPQARIEFGAVRATDLPEAPGGGKVPLPEGLDPGQRVFYVRDNGAGFDMAHVSRLFRPFQRLHTQSEFPGSGVGLATVERIVRRHGGRIWAVGQRNHGAMFCFTLSEPVAEPIKEEGHGSEKPTHPAGRRQPG